MKTRLEELLEKVAIDEPVVVEPLREIAAKNPNAPLAEVWLRARRAAYRKIQTTD